MLRLRSEEKCSGQRGSVKSELGGGLLLVYFGKYRWAKYWMAIACTDITVKLPLAMWLIS